jgi:hypothetical protein
VTTAKSLTLIAGLTGAIALTIWATPRLIDLSNERSAQPAAAVTEPAAAPAPEPRAERARPVRREPVVPAVAVDAPELHARLKPVLNRGTKLDLADDGFTSAEQFATVAHAARNTGIPFVVLKHRVLEEGKSLSAAIKESKPDLDAAAEARRARAAARDDLKGIGGA